MNRVILGIDEVGRGPFAGPLVIGACILPEEVKETDWYEELNDSKKLSRTKRENLYDKLETYAHFATGWVSANEIDEIGLLEALKLATRRAVKKIQEKKVPFTEIIIDGNQNFLENTILERYTTTMIKGDYYVKEISAASIVAKVEHDHYMFNLDEEYPEYGFVRHVGYGTPEHQKAISTYGIIEGEHRTFIKKVTDLAGLPPRPLGKTPKKNTTNTGSTAEKIVANFLEDNGHKILVLNYKTKLYEIDIISEKDDIIYFTEVKYRKNSGHGNPKDMVTPKKLEQMKFAAKAFMNYKNLQNDYKLAVGTVSGENYLFEDWFPILDF